MPNEVPEFTIRKRLKPIILGWVVVFIFIILYDSGIRSVNDILFRLTNEVYSVENSEGIESVIDLTLSDGTRISANVIEGTISNGVLVGNAVLRGSNGAILNINFDNGKVIEGNVEYEIKDYSITTNKLADQSVTNTKIVDGTITAGKLAEGIIVTNLLGNYVVTSVKIEDGAITSSKLLDGVVVSSKLADGAVTEIKLADGSVTTGKIANLAITGNKISSGTITGINIADGAIGEAKIEDGAITEIKILDGSISLSKLSSLMCANGEILKKTLTGWECSVDVGTGSVTAGGGLGNSGTASDPILDVNVDNLTIEIAGDTLQVRAGGITSLEIANQTITNEDIAILANIEWSKINKTGSSIADLTTRAFSDLTGRLAQYVEIQDAGGFFASTDAEGAIQEIGGSFFRQNGNSFGTTATIGTNDNNPFRIETNGVDRLTVLANGNVGIGTTNPGVEFEIIGRMIIRNGTSLNIYNPDVGGLAGLMVSNSYHTLLNGVVTGTDGGTSQIAIGGTVNANSSGSNFNIVLGYGSSTTGAINGAIGRQAVVNGDWSFALGYGATVNTGDNSFALGRNAVSTGVSSFALGYGATSGANQFVIGSSNYTQTILSGGNVGIGTTNPTSRLVVSDGSRPFIVDTNNVMPNWAGLSLGSATLTTSNFNFAGDGTNLQLNRASGGYIDFKHVNSTQVRILSNGNVGIGTLSAGFRLDVDGTVRSNPSSAGSMRFFAAGNDSTGVGFQSRVDYGIAFQVANALGRNVFRIGSGSTSVPALEWSDNSTTPVWDTNLFRNDVNVLRTNDSFIIDGNAGIGTTSTSAKLHVIGTTIISSTASVGGDIFLTNSGPRILNTSSGSLRIIGASSGNGAITLNEAGTGNVGIGDTNPLSRLSVAGSIVASGATLTSFRVISTDNSSYSTLGAVTGGNQVNMNVYGSSAAGNYIPGIPNANLSTVYASTTGGLLINQAANAPIYFGTQNLERMRIDGSGNVAIGTTGGVSGVRFHVEGGDALFGYTGSQRSLYVGGGDGVGNFLLGGIRGGTGPGGDGNLGYVKFGAYFNAGLAEVNYIALTRGGNVGIGTTSPSHKLHVLTTINGSSVEQGGQLVQSILSGTNSYDSIGRGFQGLTVYANASIGLTNQATNFNGIFVLPNLQNGVSNIFTNVTGIQAYTGYANVTNNATVTNSRGLWIRNWGNSLPTGGLTNQYGIYIDSISGATNNYAIYAAGGQSYFAGNVGIGTTSPQQALDVVGNLQVRDANTPTKAYRLRTSGGALDFEGAGASLFLSVWSNPDYTGTQHNQMAFSNSGNNINFYRGFYPNTDSSFNIGANDRYWSNTYTDRLYVNNNAYLDGAVDGTALLSGLNIISLATNGTERLRIDSAGAITMSALTNCSSGIQTDAGGVLSCLPSDQSLKNNVQEIDSALNIVSNLRGVTFNWRNGLYGSQREYGFIAQEVEQVAPELVFTMGTGLKGVKYAQITGLLVEAVKEQQDKIENLNSRFVIGDLPENILTQQNITSFLASSIIPDLKVNNLTVNTELRTQTLKVLAASEFFGEVFFRNNANIAGDLKVDGQILGSSNIAGRAVLKAGTTKVRVEFDKEYSKIPSVNITPVGSQVAQNSVSYYIDNQTTKSFEIVLTNQLPQDQIFNWIAIGTDTSPIINPVSYTQ